MESEVVVVVAMYRLEGAAEGYSSQLAIFNVPPVNSAIKDVQFVEYRPLTMPTRGSVLEFCVGGTSMNYIDLSRTRLRIKVKIVKAEGNAITAEDAVAPINMLLHR